MQGPGGVVQYWMKTVVISCRRTGSKVDDDVDVHPRNGFGTQYRIYDEDGDIKMTNILLLEVHDLILCKSFNNEDHVVQRNVSSVRNDALMSILDEMHEQGVQSRLANKPDMVVNDSVTSELARYKELVREYEKRAKFELTDRERKIDEQMRIIISDRNRKETSLKSELHSAQILLSSTVDHYKSKTEEVTLLKKDFKQKEDKFLEEFLDIKKLKDKIEDRLYKQDQSVQTVHMLCKPKSLYDEKHKVAIGYKNPLCLARAKQAQSALYNGHVLVTTKHTPTVIHDSEDTHNNNRKKAETLAPKPILALIVYPPNTPVKLVPRILPTKSQVKINLYVLTQLFTEFDKTCKTRITPTGITKGERGFEKTKRCYLTEVIPFFKTLKEHFVGVQTALFKEVKEMEEIFDQMNNEVDKNTVDKQCAEIEKKNLLIENENLIVNCLSTQLLYDVEKSRCLDLEADMSKVHDESKHISKLEGECLNLQLKYQHLQESFDNNKSHTAQEAPDFNSFFKIKNLEHQIQEKDNVIRNLKVLVANVNDRSCEPYNAKDVTALIEQNDCVRVELEKVKQHYKELYDSIKITRAHTSEKTSTMLNEIESLKAQLRSKESCFTSDYVKPKVLAPGMYAIDVKPIPHPLKNNRSAHLNYISHLKESVETVREIVEEARVVKPLDNTLNYACQYTKLSQELLEYVIGTCPKSFNERVNKDPSTPLTRKAQVTFNVKPGTSPSNTQKHEEHQKVQHSNIHMIPSIGVKSSTEASGSKPRSNTKNNRYWLSMETHRKETRLRKLDCGYQWRPTGKKFALGEMCHLTKLSVKCRTGHALVSGLRLFKTYDGESFKAHEFCGKVHRTILKGIVAPICTRYSSDEMMKSSHMLLVQSFPSPNLGLWLRRLKPFKLRHDNMICRKDLVRGLPRLKFEKDHLCSACQLGKSKKFSHKPKSENQTGSSSYLHMDLWGVQMMSPVCSKNPQQNGVVERRNRTLVEAARTMMIFSKSSLVSDGRSWLAPTDKELEMLFQPMFDEHLEQSRVNEPLPSATKINAQVVPPGTSLSTTIAQDAPSTSASSSTSDIHHPVQHQEIAEEP
ncbi:retrovirus-related pol polyprotein from transposon TNT 1-94, partial [Tanacetum coccineum]